MIHPSAKRTWLGVAAVFCGVLLVLSPGCNRSSQESRVSGTVSLDGKQIGPGIVIYAPVSTGTPAIGPIDHGGSYSVSTSHEVGLRAGKYKVGVSIREVPVDVKRGDRPPPGKLLIPQKYEDSATSGLEYDVAPGSNTINIELKSQSSNAAALGIRSRISHSGVKAVPKGKMICGTC